jgi:hypothetical protein
MQKHSTLVGGSSAARYIKCLGSNEIVSKCPKSGTSTYAIEGTMLHYLIEQILEKDLDPHSLIGDVVHLTAEDTGGEPCDIEVTESHIEDKILPALEWFDDELQPDEFWLEQRVSFDGELKGAHGTADVLYRKGAHAGIVDWKFGDGVLVDAKDNYQLQFYLAAAIKNDWFAKDVNNFRMYIVQPKKGVEYFDEYVSSDHKERKTLQDFEKKLLEAKRKKEAGDHTLTIGDHCGFCPGKITGICHAWRDRGKNAMLNVPRETVKEYKKTGDYDVDLIRKAYLEAREIAAWAKSVMDFVKSEFDAKRPIEGLKKVKYRDAKVWIDQKKAENFIRRQGLKASEYKEPSDLKSVSKIEKLLGHGKLKEGEHYKKTPHQFQYVSVDDPRPAVEDVDDVKASADALAKLNKTYHVWRAHKVIKTNYCMSK